MPKKPSKFNLQIHVRINDGLKKKLIRMQAENGWSQDRAVRESIRKASKVDKRERRVDELQSELEKVNQQKDILSKRLSDLEYLRDRIMKFMNFKVDYMNWHPGYLEVERDFLDEYIKYLETGIPPCGSIQEEDEEGESQSEERDLFDGDDEDED